MFPRHVASHFDAVVAVAVRVMVDVVVIGTGLAAAWHMGIRGRRGTVARHQHSAADSLTRNVWPPMDGPPVEAKVVDIAAIDDDSHDGSFVCPWAPPAGPARQGPAGASGPPRGGTNIELHYVPSAVIALPVTNAAVADGADDRHHHDDAKDEGGEEPGCNMPSVIPIVVAPGLLLTLAPREAEGESAGHIQVHCVGHVSAGASSAS